jgi:hypothetical protein
MRMRVRTAYLILAIGAALAGVMVLLIATAPDTHPRVPAPAPTRGCTPIETGELYVQRAYACMDGTQVLTFTDVTARDAYLVVANGYGVVTLSRGDTWAQIKPL